MSENFSITPPLSPFDWPESEEMDVGLDLPFQAPELNNVISLRFTCLGEVCPESKIKFHPEGYLCGGELFRILKNEMCIYTNLNSEVIELFDCHFLMETALFEECDKLFYLARQQIMSLEKGAENQMFCKNSDSNEHYLARNNICNFLNYIKVFVLKNLKSKHMIEENNDILEEIFLQLKNFLIYIGYLSNLTFIAGSKKNFSQQTPSAAFYFCHVYLDILWCTLNIVLVYKNNTGSLKNASSNITELGNYIISELLLLALQRYEQNSLQSGFQKSPFSCTCIQELWVLLILVCEAFEKDSEVDSFWTSFHKMMEVFQNSYNEKDENLSNLEIDCNQWIFPSIPLPKDFNKIGFFWWMMIHLIPLAYCDSLGNFKKDEEFIKAKSNSFSFLLENLLKSSINNECSEFVAEVQKRYYLRSLYFLKQYFHSDIKILVILWNHFHKRLNDNFSLSNQNLEGYTYLRNSAIDWFDEVQKRQEYDMNSCSTESSFHLFLRILRLNLEYLTKNGHIQEWKQMKGRFYSKFHHRQMQELSEIGLHNFLNLFLTLATIADLEDVTSKLHDLLELLDLNNLAISKLKVIWRGLFTLLLIYQDREADMAFSAQKLQDTMTKKAREFLESGGERRHQLWALLRVYLEGCQDVFEMSNHLSLSQNILIGKELAKLLISCKTNEQQTILSVIQIFLSKFRVIQKSFSKSSSHSLDVLQYQVIADNLWNEIFPIIKDLAVNGMLALPLADIAVNFTLLAMLRPPSLAHGFQENFFSVFKYFTVNEAVNSRLTCRYLSHIIPNHYIIDRLMTECSNLDTILISSWIRCSLFLSDDDDQLQELTRLIFKLPSIENLLTKLPSVSTDANILDFIKALNFGNQNLQSWKEKMDYKEKVHDYLWPMAKYLSLAIKPSVTPNMLKTVYNICGHLVNYCSELIYAKSKSESLLPVLIDRLILPPALLAYEKNLHPGFFEAIKDSLHLFVQGLSKLMLIKDTYIQRKLKEIVVNYFLRFPVKQMSSNFMNHVHPLIASLNESYTCQPPNYATELRQFFLTVIRDTFMNIHGSNLPTHLGLVLSFIHEVFHQTSQESEIALNCNILLLVTLDCCLLCDIPNTKKESFNILQYLLESCKRKPDVVIRSDLVAKLETFMKKHIKLSSGRLFKTLESVCLLYRELAIDFIPGATQILRDWEEERGVGVDHLIRQQYKNLLKQLGVFGAEEIKKLNTEIENVL